MNDPETMKWKGHSDLTTIQEILGHKGISTTKIYSHVTDNHKAGALERLAGGKKPNLRLVENED